ncbi:MAG TPA: SRPBCC domain-containing protein [Flavisolibacter sp.]|nr:SRPBCC domain-containing protein [Flavisolibacter sp.]
MAVQDWTRFLLRIPINISETKIYHAISTQDGLETWFLRQAKFKKENGADRNQNETIGKNDTYEWRWFGWPDEVKEKGSILQVNKDSIKFIFGKAGIVTFSIKNEDGTIILELIQSEIPSEQEAGVDYYMGCSKGWQFYMTNLKSILEGGIDLRNKNVLLKDVVNS